MAPVRKPRYSWPITEVGLTFGDCHRDDLEQFARRSSVGRRVRIARIVERLNRRIKTVGDLAKQSVIGWQGCAVDTGDHKKLAAVGIGSRIGHCN